ncbi:MAG: efflux RND transporter permease subunit, partial [Verrucomicrobiales bacterium]
NQEREKGLDAVTAMMNAGRIRLRPILMTSFATIAGILPIALGLGEAAEGRRPLGVVAVGGMLTSTVLTLVVIPVIYTLLSGRSRPKGNPEEPSPGTDSAA